MQLNADLGESFGPWPMGNDAAIMPFIDQANIACGYHAGDAIVMRNAIALAKQHNVKIGAHVSYPDMQGFGRRSMHIPSSDLIAMIQAQVATLEGLSLCQNMSLSHVKPHGALYNDMMKNVELFTAVVQALSEYHTVYPLMMQAVCNNDQHVAVAAKYSVPLLFEAFADRAYTQEGFLQSRTLPSAVLSHELALQQVQALLNNGHILSADGHPISIVADTICIHSDSPDALLLAEHIHQLITRAKHA